MSALRPGLALCLVAASLVPARAEAQSRAEEARRATLIQQATQARSQRQWEQVVQLLTQVAEIRESVSVRLGLAGAYSELGQHREAATQAALCLELYASDRESSSQQRTSISQTCAELLHTSARRVAAVDVEVSPPETQGMTLRANQIDYGAVLPGRTYYLDPGRQHLRLLFNGNEVASSMPYLREGTTQTIRFSILSGGRPIGLRPDHLDVAPPASSTRAQSRSASSSRLTIPAIGIAAGATLVVGGIMFGQIGCEGSWTECSGGGGYALIGGGILAIGSIIATIVLSVSSGSSSQ